MKSQVLFRGKINVCFVEDVRQKILKWQQKEN